VRALGYFENNGGPVVSLASKKAKTAPGLDRRRLVQRRDTQPVRIVGATLNKEFSGAG